MMDLQRVLHVDDDPDIREVAVMALEMLGGFTVATCDSGAKAVETALSFAPDVILLDMMMPGMDGPATLNELRKNPGTAAIPVIFMTAKVQAHEVGGYLALGAAGVIAKPFDPTALSGQIKDILRRASGTGS